MCIWSSTRITKQEGKKRSGFVAERPHIEDDHVEYRTLFVPVFSPLTIACTLGLTAGAPAAIWNHPETWEWMTDLCRMVGIMMRTGPLMAAMGLPSQRRTPQTRTFLTWEGNHTFACLNHVNSSCPAPPSIIWAVEPDGTDVYASDHSLVRLTHEQSH